MGTANVSPARLAAALEFAARVHQGQIRKGSAAPYISHPLIVAGLVLEYGGSEDEAVAALLHDTVEDGAGADTLAEIEAAFGVDIADIVEGCSDTMEKPKPDWRLRKERHLQHLATATPSVAIVVAADKLANARAIMADLREHGDGIWARFRGGREGTLWYYRESLRTLRPLAPARLIGELDSAVDEIHQTVGVAQ